MSQVKPIPEGLRTLTPQLVVHDGKAALAFYEKAFGAEVVHSAPDPSGQKVWHAALRIGDSQLFVNDEFPDMGVRAPKSLGGSAHSIWIYVDKVDELFARAVGAGAQVKMPPMDMFWGDRMGQVVDPFGHTWVLATHVKDMTEDEMRKAGEAFAKQMAHHGGGQKH